MRRMRRKPSLLGDRSKRPKSSEHISMRRSEWYEILCHYCFVRSPDKREGGRIKIAKGSNVLSCPKCQTTFQESGASWSVK